MKYRVEFAKRDSVAFVSHLELMKVFSQAIRRAGLPIACTEGFNPRPKINFSSAIATGMTSLAECAEMELLLEMDAEEIRERLNETLPKGFSIGAIRQMEGKHKSLMALLSHSDYQVRVRLPEPFSASADLEEAVNSFLDQDSIVVLAKRKNKVKEKEIREGILSIEARAEGDFLYLKMQLVAGSNGNVRPEHVAKALMNYLGAESLTMRIEKTMTYGLKDDEKTRLFLV
jgi:radical SAM-linked protein